MKKFFTLFCVVAMISAVTAQESIKVDYASMSLLKQVNPAKKSQALKAGNSANRASTGTFLLDYDAVDRQYTADMGYDYKGFRSNINGQYKPSDIFTFGYAAVFFDTLQYVDPADEKIKFIPRSAATIHIDTILVSSLHENTTGREDTIRISIFRTDSTLSGAALTNLTLWDTVIYTSTSLPVNATSGLNDLLFAPNIQLAKGKSFGIRADFRGDTANTFELFSGIRDECASACFGGEPAYSGKTSGYQFNYNNNSGFYYSTTMPLYYPCDSDGTVTPHACEEFPVQNWWMLALVTIDADYGAAIVADSLRGCPGDLLTLRANPFGSSSSTFTYNWATTSGTLTGTSSDEVGLIVGNTSGVVTVTVTEDNGGATTTATVNVTSRGIGLTINGANPDSIACGSGNKSITTTTSGLQTGKVYTWSTGFTAGGNQGSFISVNLAGTYNVTVTNNSGCSASASAVIQYPGVANNNVSFTNPSPLCQNRQLTFTNTSSRTSGWNQIWHFGVADIVYGLNGVYSFATAGVNTVYLEQDSANCVFKSRTSTLVVQPSSSGQCNTSGVDDISFASAVNLVPNPSNGNVSIIVNGVEKNLSIRVYNMLGSEVKVYNASENASTVTKTFDFSDLASGTYLVKIQTADKTAVKRLSISK